MNFITGKLEKNEHGAAYEGKVYDSWLTLRLAEGKLVRIFDDIAITLDLKVGGVYQLIVQASFPKNLTTYPTHSPEVENADWWGKVVALEWTAPQMSYRHVNDALFRVKWVLIETPSGQLVLNPYNLDKPTTVDNFVKWNQIRMDLLAVI